MTDQYTTTRFARVAALAVLLCLGLAACGGSDSETATNDLPADSTTSSETTTTTEATTTSTSTTSAVASTPEPIPDEALPGEPFDFGPGAGAELAVVGVAFDDVLNLRRLPDPSAEILAVLDPVDTIEITGRKRLLDDSIWVEVMLEDDGVAWANEAFLKALAGTRDVTTEVTELLGGTLPTAESFEDLVAAFATQIAAASTEDGEGSPAAATVASSSQKDSAATATVDVIGYLDDSVLGERLTLTMTGDGSNSFTVASIESTAICQRGSDDGLCL